MSEDKNFCCEGCKQIYQLLNENNLCNYYDLSANPGVIKTAMIDRFTGKKKEVERQFENPEPVGRMGTPEEVAEAVAWLCSDAASCYRPGPGCGWWMGSSIDHVGLLFKAQLK